ncbi:hypothetical protein E4P39_17105 [Blastococcus sp. CT_GayMR19]|uniref:allene oxide cyclase barrel-like domain-containing protein n=1 Tax=Blastococcus sp. CT_GayMR19 TaxID=2559608 RepID=UPI0010736435|nr:hypothetical protein [Blastococcus sp. CT_GayMR19]TFV72212.1 hypothetical protein E4P39_17105 [Blastococcus sp. CT_GayMR19]
MTPIRSARRPLLVAAVLVAGAGAGTTLAVVPAASADQTLRLTTVKVPDRSTELDLGNPEFGPGDTEIFVDDVQRRGRTIGSQAGSCTVAAASETRLVVLCTTTWTLPDGSLTTQGAGDENPSQGPAGIRWAVTGGTGRYAGAAGEAVGTFRPDSDVIDWEIRVD